MWSFGWVWLVLVGRRIGAVDRIFRWFGTSGALAMHRTVPASCCRPLPTSMQAMPILNTRCNRCAQVMAACRCTGDLDSICADSLPRTVGVICFRKALFGANTPWNRVRLTRGLGPRAASLAIKSNGSRTMCVVLSR